MRYRLRTLLIVLALGPAIIAIAYWNPLYWLDLSILSVVLLLLACWMDSRRTDEKQI